MDTLALMRAFVAVAQMGSFGRAAQQLGHSPQLVSKYVSGLEAHLDVRLLQRTTRKVALTEAGALYLERCQQVLADIDDMENALGDLSNHVRGVLRISAPMSFGTRHLMPALIGFRGEYPSVEFDLQLSDRHVDLLEEGFDVALRIGRLSDSSFVARRLMPMRLVLCASESYLAQQGALNVPADLYHHQFLGYHYLNASIFQGRAAALGKVLMRLKPAIRANNGDVLAQAAALGQGIALLPTFIVGEEIAKGTLCELLPECAPEALALYAIYADRRHLASKVRYFVSYLSEYFSGEPDWDQFD